MACISLQFSQFSWQFVCFSITHKNDEEDEKRDERDEQQEDECPTLNILTYCKIVLLWKRSSFYVMRTIWADVEKLLFYTTIEPAWTSNKGIESDYVGDLY